MPVTALTRRARGGSEAVAMGGGTRRIPGRRSWAALVGLGAWASCLGALADPARAQEREVVLRFLPPAQGPITGYQVYLSDVATQLEEVLDVGFVAPDADGVARTTLLLDAARSYDVGMTAYNDAGESPLSNLVHIPAEAPVCDAALCDDGDPCSADSCDAAGCLSTPLPDGSACDDGYVDTVDDRCTQGVCAGDLLACRGDTDCDDGDVCNGLEVCDGGSVCLEGIALDCGAPSACSVPRCDALEGCWTELRPDGTACDDGLAETRDDVCRAGACQGLGEAPLALEAVDPGVVGIGRHTLAILGSGFTAGASVSFLNGEGRAPRVVALRLLDPATLEVTIDVSRKGPRRSRFWDVLVRLPDGSEAALAAALRVDP